MTSASPATARRPFQGVWQIVRYNWPFYVAGTLACAFGAVVLQVFAWPTALFVLGWLGVAVGAWWLLASLLVSYWVYDASPLYTWRWLPALLPQMPTRWANIHSGLDESSLALREMFGGDGVTIDIYNAQEMTEPSIARARRITPAPVEAISADYRQLPFSDNALDAIFLIFAAHEIRDANSRDLFWHELHRVLDDGGTIVLVEHLRDVANFLAFGPGFGHFLPRGEWLRLFRETQFSVHSETRLTPWVRVWVLQSSTR